MTVATANAAGAKPAKPARQKLPVWPMVWELVRPRRGMLFLGLLLMGINRVSGLVLPWSAKSLIDDVIGKRQAQLLLHLGEAALEVGYSSLSHFSQSFCQVMGRCPGLYPIRNSLEDGI